MCTVKLPPAARSAGPQLSTCGAEPEIEHRPGIDWASIDQVTPGAGEPAGSGSVTVTPCTVPVPLLVTATWNPIGSRAFTDAASSVLTMWIATGLQVMLALMEPHPEWLALLTGVLSYSVVAA